MKGLDPGAYWERLESEPVPESVNLDDMLRPPTERDADVNPEFRCTRKFE